MVTFSLFCWLFVYIDNSRRKIISLSSLPLLIFMTMSFFSLKDAPSYMFSYRSFSSYSIEYYYTYFIFLISFIFAILISRFIIVKLCKKTQKEKDIENIKFLKKVFYTSSILCLCAFSFNINNAIDLLLSGGYIRNYEEEFGSSSIINYFYFLHVISIPVYYYIRYVKKEHIRFGTLIFILVALTPFFHGIKFTVFDAFFPTIVIYYLLNEKLRVKFFLYFFTIALVFLYLFFTYARGTSYDVTWYQAIINYIIPNYYNLGYTIKHFGYSGMFDYGFQLFYPPKLPIPESINNIITSTSGFLLNYRYNMYTAIQAFYRVFGVFSGVGYLFFIILISISYVFAFNYNKFRYYFIFAVLVTCNFLSFYYWMLFKLKYIWLIVFVMLISFIFRLRLNSKG